MVKDSKNEISASRVLIISLLVDFLDVTLGIAVSIVSGSVIMLSEALEGAADLLASGLLVVGLNRSRKKADSSHPFGYGRELYFWTLISGLIMLFITSTLTLYFGWQRIFHPKIVQHTNLVFAVLTIAALSNGYAFSLSLRRLLHSRSVKRLWSVFINSSLIETKSAFVLDLMGTAASLVGLIAMALYVFTGDSRFDGIGAVAIGIVLAILSILLLWAIKEFLVGRSVPIYTIERIKNAVSRISEVQSVQDLKAVHMGEEKIMINIEINAQDNLTTDALEKMIDQVKDEIRKDIPGAGHIQVELESPGVVLKS